MENFKDPLPPESLDRRTLLDRILDTPQLEQVVPRLQPALLHRVIQKCGLEDCGELVALATPEQLTRIFDFDLWRSAQPGMDEQFDAARFGVWLDVLAELDAGLAAQKLAEMDPDLVIAGLAQHVRVFDGAAVTHEFDHALEFDVGGYRLFAKCDDSWEAIVTILISLDAEHHDYFHRVMRGCRELSNAGFELDELDDLLSRKHQVMFDLALEREQRRDQQGYVPPAQARAFLAMSRQFSLDSESFPTAKPMSASHPDRLNEATAAQHATRSTSTAAAAAALAEVLFEAGIIGQQPRALLNASQNYMTTLQLIRTQMQFLLESDHSCYASRSEELTYVANTLMSGCAFQGRPFTVPEAWDAAAAVCNLGLENWPPQWSLANSLPEDFLVNHDLVTVFQVGWTVLHKNVGIHTAEQLLRVLSGLRRVDRTIQTELAALRMELSKSVQAGAPWRARTAMEVIAILDTPAWAALLGLIDECPVLHAALRASKDPKARAVSASDFEFISENSQIASIRDFLQSLPEILRP